MSIKEFVTCTLFKNKLFTAMTIILLLLGITMTICSARMGWTLLYPYDPLRIDKIELNKKVAKQGEEVCFQFYGEKLMDIPAQVSVELVNRQTFEVAKYSSYYPVTTSFRERCFLVPYNVKPHKYRLRWTATYAVSGIRNVVKSHFGEEIEIRAGAPNGTSCNKK